ncbi:hypothetical protein [Microbacterium sp. ZW T5_56]|uniref:hypothetical protein n=1 Tax=Microbacterium sp. ZW T5_56 TaxID=3378081 RepID=UPI003852E8E6
MPILSNALRRGVTPILNRFTGGSQNLDGEEGRHITIRVTGKRTEGLSIVEVPERGSCRDLALVQSMF